MRNVGKLLLAALIALGACKKDRTDDDDDRVVTRDTTADTATVPGPGTGTTTGERGDTSYGAQPGTGTAQGPGTSVPHMGGATGQGMGTGTAAGAGTGTGAATGAGATTGTTGSTAMAMPSDAQTCPSTVAGAVTTVKSKPGDADVVLSIVGTENDATRQIRDRIKQMKSRASGPDATKRSGTTTATGREVCPVMLTDVTMETKEVEGGVEVTLKPKSGAQTADLRQRVDERIQASKDWTSSQSQGGTTTGTATGTTGSTPDTGTTGGTATPSTGGGTSP